MISGTTKLALQTHHLQAQVKYLGLHTTLQDRGRRVGRVKTSLYNLLGVESTATTKEIRAAYRRLATIYHPDVNRSGAAIEKFQALKLTADVLTSDLRQQYDQLGLSALAGREFQLLHDFTQKVRVQGVAAVFGEAGGNISTVLGIEFSESVTGSSCTVTTGALGTCPDCKGDGYDSTQSAPDCPMCHGRGEVTMKKWFGSNQPRMSVVEVCPVCAGSGKSDVKCCSRCGGEGRLQVRRHVRIRVPAGVVDGQVLRVKGQGHMGKFGGAPGDLLVKLQVYNLAGMTRKGDDLYSKLALSIYETLLGGVVDVKTIRGGRILTVPQGTQHGDTLCARDAGVARPGLSGVEYGHHYYQVNVQIPNSQEASAAELQLLQQLANLLQEAQQPQGQQQQSAQVTEDDPIAEQSHTAGGAQVVADDSQDKECSGSQGSVQEEYLQHQRSAQTEGGSHLSSQQQAVAGNGRGACPTGSFQLYQQRERQQQERQQSELQQESGCQDYSVRAFTKLQSVTGRGLQDVQEPDRIVTNTQSVQ